jgi:hypothetical protein
MEIWPSRKVGVYAWFGLLNAVGTLIAAVPVSILVNWLIEGNRVRAAFTVGAPTAFLMIASVIDLQPFSGHRSRLPANEP